MQPEVAHEQQSAALPTSKGDSSATPAQAEGANSRVQIKNVDMPEEMQERAVELAREAIVRQHSPRDIAGAIKKEFDRLYGPAWHCIVGKSFGSFVTHEAHCFVFFYLDNWAIMLFKTA